jgi:predicted transcriptional regulator
MEERENRQDHESMITQSPESFEEMSRKVSKVVRDIENVSAKVSRLSDATEQMVDHISNQ